MQLREVGLIPEGVNFGENMSLKRSLRRGSTLGVSNRGLCMAVIEAKNQWKRWEVGRGGVGGLSMIETYNQVENALGLHLIYLQII